MIPMNIVLLEDHVDNLMNRLKELEKQEAMVGLQKSQGIHQDSGLHYVDLMNIHHHGSSKHKIPARPVSVISTITYAGHNELKKDLKKYLSNISAKRPPISASTVVTNWAKDFHKHSQAMFGNTTHLKSNTQYTIDRKKVTKSNSPLLDTGDLKQAWGAWVNGVKVN